MLTTFIGYVVMLSMLIFFVVNILCFKEPVKTVKHAGIGFIFMNSLCAVLGTIIPISEDLYKLDTTWVSCLAILLTICYIVYGRMLRVEIIMFLCRV